MWWVFIRVLSLSALASVCVCVQVTNVAFHCVAHWMANTTTNSIKSRSAKCIRQPIEWMSDRAVSSHSWLISFTNTPLNVDPFWQNRPFHRAAFDDAVERNMNINKHVSKIHLAVVQQTKFQKILNKQLFRTQNFNFTSFCLSILLSVSPFGMRVCAWSYASGPKSMK